MMVACHHHGEVSDAPQPLRDMFVASYVRAACFDPRDTRTWEQLHTDANAAFDAVCARLAAQAAYQASESSGRAARAGAIASGDRPRPKRMTLDQRAAAESRALGLS